LLKEVCPMRGWGFYVSIAGRPVNWIVSVVFMLVGLVIVLALAPNIEPMPDRDGIVLIVRVFGGVFFFLGLLIFVGTVVDLALAGQDPARRERWYSRSTALIALFAAGLFAVPATLAFPLLLVAYIVRPTAYYASDSPDMLHNLMVGLIFSIAGLLSLGLLYITTRKTFRT
jgi:hypothetical protein